MADFSLGGVTYSQQRMEVGKEVQDRREDKRGEWTKRSAGAARAREQRRGISSGGGRVKHRSPGRGKRRKRTRTEMRDSFIEHKKKTNGETERIEAVSFPFGRGENRRCQAKVNVENKTLLRA